MYGVGVKLRNGDELEGVERGFRKVRNMVGGNLVVLQQFEPGIIVVLK